MFKFIKNLIKLLCSGFNKRSRKIVRFMSLKHMSYILLNILLNNLAIRKACKIFRDNIKDVELILNNLRYEDREELIALWGNNWEIEVIESIKPVKYTILYGFNKYNKVVPIAVGGIAPIFDENKKIACAWLLSSNDIKYNKQLLLKTLKNVINSASLKYEIMYNYIYKSNVSAKKWLKKFGFKFDNPRPETLNIPAGFEFFYKLSEKISQ